MCPLQAQINFSHPVQYINSAQIRLYTNALSSVLQSVAPELSEITAPTCTGGFVLPAPPFAPEPDATITSVYEVGKRVSARLQRRAAHQLTAACAVLSQCIIGCILSRHAPIFDMVLCRRQTAGPSSSAALPRCWRRWPRTLHSW